MGLKLVLKPNEQVIIAGASLRNGPSSATLLVENNVPVLRGKDILREKEARTAAQRIYFVVQLMYLDQENLPGQHKLYWQLVADFLGAAPSARGLIEEISGQILAGHYYKALKSARKLIAYEATLMARAKTAGESSLPAPSGDLDKVDLDPPVRDLP